MPHVEETRAIAGGALALADPLSQAPAALGADPGLADALSQLPAAIPADQLQFGAWVPADASGAGLALTVDSATWVKLGRLVMARAKLNYPVTASAAFAKLSGLPFACDGTQASRQGFLSYSNAPSCKYCSPDLSATTMSFYNNASASAANSDMSGGSLWFTVLYTTNP